MEAHCRVEIINKRGLHARAAARFASLAAGFASRIQVWQGERLANGKSIMGLMMLAAAQGSAIHIHAQGEDAEQAIEALRALVDDRFGEAE